MKNKGLFTLILSSIIIFTILIVPTEFSMTKSYKLENLSDNFYVLPDQDNGFYIIDNNKNFIKYFYKENQDYTLKNIDIDNKPIATKVANKNLYILIKGQNQNLNILKYKNEDIIGSSNSLSSSIFFTTEDLFENNYNNEQNYLNSFAIDNKDNIYFINKSQELYCVDTVGDANKVYDDDKLTSISINSSGTELYALTENKNFLSFDISSSDSSLKEFEGSPDDHFYFLNDNFIISYSGKVYNINESDNKIEEAIVSDSRWPAMIACTFKDYILCKVNDTTINCFSHKSLNEYIAIKKVELNKVLCLSSSKDTCIAFVYDNGSKSITILKEDDFKDIQENPDNDTSDSNGSLEDNNNKENISNDNLNLKSSSYEIDYEKSLIKKVPLFTTPNIFKENITFSDEYSISFKNYLGKNISTGKLGTASTVIFEKDNSSITFNIIVSGDITGEGNVNNHDKDTLYDYLMGKSELYDEYLLASDLNSDGIINTLDLLAIHKAINSQ